MPAPPQTKPGRTVRWARASLSFVGGLAIMYHEVVVAPTSEPLLVLVALYLLGVPVVELLNQLRDFSNLTRQPGDAEPAPEPPARRSGDQS